MPNAYKKTAPTHVKTSDDASSESTCTNTIFSKCHNQLVTNKYSLLQWAHCIWYVRWMAGCIRVVYLGKGWQKDAWEESRRQCYALAH